MDQSAATFCGEGLRSIAKVTVKRRIHTFSTISYHSLTDSPYSRHGRGFLFEGAYRRGQSHKETCQPPRSKYTPLETRSATIKATLYTLRAPRISRVLQCPAGRSFHTLHKALQAAFGWTNSHTYSFMARDITVEKDRRRRRFKPFVELLHPDMRPESLYLSEFDDGQPVHDHNFPTLRANQLRFGDVFGKPEWRDAEWTYRYDYGDNWEHTIEFLGWGEPVDEFSCTEALGHGACEDCGGAGGWEFLKDSFRAEEPDEEHEERMGWYLNFAANGDPEGLKGRERVVDLEAINRELAGIV